MGDKGLYALIAIFLIVTPILLTPWIHGHDGLGHYMILRSPIIDGDLDFTNEIEQYREKFPDLRFPISEITERPYTHYGIGNALLWAPFFLLAQGYVLVHNLLGGSIDADGFSYPYLLLTHIGTAIYTFAALLLFYSLIKNLFTQRIAFWTTLLVWFGTPLVYYMYFSATTSHAASFFAITLFLYYWYNTRKERTAKQWVMLGALSAFVFMVRQEDALVLIFPAIESLHHYFVTFKKGQYDFDLFKKNLLYLAALGIGIFIQLSFFKQVYGKYFVAGEQLAFHEVALSNALYFYKVLLSIDNGLFVWIPLTLFGVCGWHYLKRKDALLAANCLAVFILFVIFTASLKQWISQASLSARHFIGVLGIFGFGAAALWNHFQKRINYHYFICASVVLILWNLNLVLQYGAGLIGTQDPLHLPTVLYNALYVLPKKIVSIISNFLFERGNFITP